MPRVTVREDTIQWLLDPENPPVRFLTLTRLLGRPERSRDVREAKGRLGDYAPTRAILADRCRFLKKGRQLYQKYRGGYWQVLFLGEFLAPRDLEGVEEGVEFVLEQGRGFLKDRSWYGIHCLNSNLLRAMVALGFGSDERVRAGLEHVAAEVVAGRGVPCPVIDWSVYKTCRMTLPKVLLAMTALPEKDRSPRMKRAARICRDQLLEQEVSRYVSPVGRGFAGYLESQPGVAARSISLKPEKRAAIVQVRDRYVTERGGLGERVDKAGWLRFGFPLHYNSDSLEALLALAQAGTPRRSPSLRHPLDTVVGRMRTNGRWKLDFSLNGKMIADVERKGAASRWITLRALLVLDHFLGIDVASS